MEEILNTGERETFEFEYEGRTFEADRRELTSYRNSKAIANSSNRPDGYFTALGGGAEAVANLYVAAVEAVGAKNY